MSWIYASFDDTRVGKYLSYYNFGLKLAGSNKSNLVGIVVARLDLALWLDAYTCKQWWKVLMTTLVHYMLTSNEQD